MMVFLHFWVIFNVVNIVCSDVIPSSTEDTAEETQHAVCKIITKEIQTSANATIKRQLKGVCTSRQLERKFRQLERKILTELDHIKEILGRNPTVRTTDDYEYFNYDEKSLNGKKPSEDIVSVTEILTNDFSWYRTEIDQLNNTMYTINGEKVYTYYWKIPDVRSFFEKNDAHLQTPDFYVLGHQLRLQLYSQHSGLNYMGVELIAAADFRKHKFTILDQIEADKDIVSPSFDGLDNEKVYRVPYAKLEERHYLDNDTLFLKLSIYLNA